MISVLKFSKLHTSLSGFNKSAVLTLFLCVCVGDKIDPYVRPKNPCQARLSRQKICIVIAGGGTSGRRTELTKDCYGSRV